MNFPHYSSLFCFLLLLLASSSSLGQRQQWEPANYPNPTAGDFQRCNMRSRALLCDPDSVLSEAERYKLNYELQQLESSTRQEHGREFCERKGITAAVALAKRVRGGNEEAVRAMANDMLGRWNIDAQCQKAIVIVLSTEDRHFWVARRPRVPVYSTELNELFKAERETFRSGRYGAGIQNVVRAIRDAALAKQQPAPDDGRSKGTPFVPPKPSKPKPSRPQPEPSGGGGGLKLNWLLLLALFFFVVLPLLCCCCCLYFCCFRKKDGGGGGGGGGANPNISQPDPERGAGRAGGGGGRFGNLPLAGLMGGIGGAASNFFNKRRGGGGGQGPAAGGGGQAPPPYYDPVPQNDHRGQQPVGGTGKGLYPNVPVKDEGGGGSW